MGPLSFTEMAIIFFVALLVFGPRKLPEIGRTLGKGLREFRKASDDLKSSWAEHIREAEEPIRDIKQTFNEVKTEVETTATSITDDTPSPAETETTQESAPATITEESTTAPEETKPDGHAN